MFCIVTTSFSGSLFAALQHAPTAGSTLSGTPCTHYFSFMLRSTTMCPPLSSSLPLLLLHSQLVYTKLQQVYVSWSWLGLDQIPSLLFSESTTGSMSYTSDALIFLLSVCWLQYQLLEWLLAWCVQTSVSTFIVISPQSANTCYFIACILSEDCLFCWTAISFNCTHFLDLVTQWAIQSILDKHVLFVISDSFYWILTVLSSFLLQSRQVCLAILTAVFPFHFQVFFTLWYNWRKFCGPIHVCLSVLSFIPLLE
jgi:hypothetical protein